MYLQLYSPDALRNPRRWRSTPPPHFRFRRAFRAHSSEQCACSWDMNHVSHSPSHTAQRLGASTSSSAGSSVSMGPSQTSCSPGSAPSQPTRIPSVATVRMQSRRARAVRAPCTARPWCRCRPASAPRASRARRAQSCCSPRRLRRVSRAVHFTTAAVVDGWRRRSRIDRQTRLRPNAASLLDARCHQPCTGMRVWIDRRPSSKVRRQGLRAQRDPFIGGADTSTSRTSFTG